MPAPAAPIEHHVRWKHLGRMWYGNMWRAARELLPLAAAAVLGTAFLRGSLPSLRTSLLVTLAMFALQRCVHIVGSLLIVPAQRSLLRLLQYLHAHPRAATLAPQLRDDFTPTLRMLERMENARVSSGQVLLQIAGAERVSITTPDGGAVIDGVVFDREAAHDRRAFILALLGNGEFWEHRSDLLSLRQRGYGLMMINYRGVGESTGWTTRDGAVCDVACAIAFLRDVCGVEQGRIVVLGHSIGSAFAAQAAVHFPGILLVSDRSFSRLSTLAMQMLTPWAVGPDAKGTRHLAARYAVHCLVRTLTAWEMDSEQAWQEWAAAASCAAQGSSDPASAEQHGHRRHGIVISSHHDAVIPVAAQLRTAMLRRLEDEAASAAAGSSPAGAGAAPSVLWSEMTMVLPTGGGGGRSDEHNRGFSQEEEARLCRAIDDHLAGRPLLPSC